MSWNLALLLEEDQGGPLQGDRPGQPARLVGPDVQVYIWSRAKGSVPPSDTHPLQPLLGASGARFAGI